MRWVFGGVVASVLVVSAAACAPTIEDGHFACEPGVAGNCPDGYSCVGGRCRSETAAIDGGRIDSGLAPDGGEVTDGDVRPPDAGSDAGPVCIPACPGDELCCGETCIDPMSDPDHCGGCDHACSGACVDGACVCVLDSDCDDGNACTSETCDDGACMAGPVTSCGACAVCNTTTGDCDPMAAGVTCDDDFAMGEQPCEATECDGAGSCVPANHCDGDPALRLDTTPGVACSGTLCVACGSTGEACCTSYVGRPPRDGCADKTSTCDPFPICGL